MRRLGLIAVVTVLAACGSADGTSDPASDTLLPIDRLLDRAPGDLIEVLPDSEIARMLAADVSVDPWPVADGVSVESGMGERWIGSNEPPTDGEVLALADLFGIDGDVERAEDVAFGGEVRVGDLQGGAGALVVTNYSEPAWYLQQPDAVRTEVGSAPCPTFAFDDSNYGQCADGTSTDLAEPPSTTVTADLVDALMVVVGVPAEQFRAEYFPFYDTVNVAISFGGSDAVDWSLTVRTGSDGEAVVVEGSGPLRSPVLLDEVPTVGLDAAMQRLGRLIPGVPADVPADVIPSNIPSTTALLVPVTADDGSVIATAPPPTFAPVPFEFPVIRTAEPAFATIWDVQNRQWLVPALLVTGDNGFTTTVPTISADLIRVVEPTDASVPVRTGPPLTVPQGSNGAVPPPTVIASPFPIPDPPSGPPPTGTATPLTPVPTPVAAPPMQSSTTSMPGTTHFPRPTLPGPDATLVSDNGTPVTIPIPPDPNEVAPDAIPDFYEESLHAVLVGRSLDEAITLLELTGWETRTDDLDDPNETFLTDLRPGRVTVQHRRNTVVSIFVG